MRTIPLLVLSLLLSLVEEVHCQQTFPYVSFMDQTLANHSYVNLSTVGNDDLPYYIYYDDEYQGDNVLCVTDLGSCCSGRQGPFRGDWYFPSGERVQFSGTISEGRAAQLVAIRRTTATEPNGIYRCDIATNAVHDVTDISVRDTVYVGLYTGDGGNELIVLMPCISHPLQETSQ